MNLSIFSIKLISNKKVNIHNIYNFEKNSVDESTLSTLKKALKENRDDEHIMINDFNLYYFK